MRTQRVVLLIGMGMIAVFGAAAPAALYLVDRHRPAAAAATTLPCVQTVRANVTGGPM